LSQPIRRKSDSARRSPGPSGSQPSLDRRDFRLYEIFGADGAESDGTSGTRFTVWAPEAERVSVIGDFNDWAPGKHELCRMAGESGIWEGFVAGVAHGALYKYRVEQRDGHVADEPDPFARAAEAPPGTASQVWCSRQAWGDQRWMSSRGERMSLAAPWSIYEVHLDSWRRDPAEPGRLLGYRELAATLPPYVAQLGFTHVALMRLTDHADNGSVGYRCSGYFAPSSRFGTPDDLRSMVDALHRQGIGVLLDWIPPAFETHDFMVSNALYWLDEFHVDGLRLIDVPSLLRRDDGGEDEQAVAKLVNLNQAIHDAYPDARTIADAAVATSRGPRTTGEPGLGFDLVWNSRRVRDALEYVRYDPLHRKHHHGLVTLDKRDATREHDILPLSHEEVAPGHGSLIDRIPGDDWQRFATMRVLLGYLWTVPGKKLMFMGDEFAQRREWRPDVSLDWHLLDDDRHRAMHRWVGDLNRLLREQPVLHEVDSDPAGFEWLVKDEADLSLLAFERRCPGRAPLLVVCNFTPVVRENYRVGVCADGQWSEIINSDAAIYGGSGTGNLGGVGSVPIASHGRFTSIVVTVPPLAMISLVPSRPARWDKERE
jgi:1,4-alpha-glucan branching enzyme